MIATADPSLPAVLFDLDGTLTDPAIGITRCLTFALGSLGKPVPPETELRACIGPPLQKTLPLLLQSDDPSLAQKALYLYRERFATVGKYENFIYPGIPEVLETLRAEGHPLFVATSKPAIYARDILAHFGLDSFFAGVYGSELTGERSDKTDLLAYPLAQEKRNPADCVMIGDRRHDVEGAHSNGMRCIGVTWGYGYRQELLAAGADSLCDTVAELPDRMHSLRQAAGLRF